MFFFEVGSILHFEINRPLVLGVCMMGSWLHRSFLPVLFRRGFRKNRSLRNMNASCSKCFWIVRIVSHSIDYLFPNSMWYVSFEGFQTRGILIKSYLTFSLKGFFSMRWTGSSVSNALVCATIEILGIRIFLRAGMFLSFWKDYFLHCNELMVRFWIHQCH